LPSDDILDTNYINPNLVPTLPGIGKPYNIQHNIHVQVDDYGLVGLPLEWQKILQASGVIQSSTIPLPPTSTSTISDQDQDQEMSSLLQLLQQNQDHQHFYAANTNDAPLFTDTLLQQLQHRPLPVIDIIDHEGGDLYDDHYDDTSNNTSPITHETCKLLIITTLIIVSRSHHSLVSFLQPTHLSLLLLFLLLFLPTYTHNRLLFYL
jgi:hypothetical protein